MKTCPTCPRQLHGKRKHCPICQAKRRSEKQVGRLRGDGPYYGPGQHPNSRANLRLGAHAPASAACRLARAKKGGEAMARKHLERLERDALGFGGEVALEAFRAGYRVGYNRASQRARKADREAAA